MLKFLVTQKLVSGIFFGTFAGVAIATSVIPDAREQLRAAPTRIGDAIVSAFSSTGAKDDSSRFMKSLTAKPGLPALAAATSDDPSLAQLASIPSNFDINSELVPSWGSGDAAPSASPDVVGAFRFMCNPGRIAADDPIVYPGQPGRSHLHQFFGNTQVDAHSTYASLRGSGNTTCSSPLNRSAYWMPAMLDGRGGVVRPDYVSVYYKRLPSSDPQCQRQGRKCVSIPRGLRFVYGYDMANPAASPVGANYFNCDGPTAVPGHYPDLIEAARNCPAGNRIGALIGAPECWDGVNLDSPNHRSHMAYSAYVGHTYPECPATHPYVIPSFTMGAWYSVDDNLDRSGVWTGQNTWHLSSDVMPEMGMGMMKPGTTFHADWFGAWDDTVLSMWTANCIDKKLNCSGGDLGNGRQMKMAGDFTWTASPHSVPIPTNGSPAVATSKPPVMRGMGKPPTT